MPLLRDTKLPPPSGPGEKTLWDYFPRGTVRRVLFLILALGAVLFLKSAGGGSLAGLFDTLGPPHAARPGEGAAGAPVFYPIQVPIKVAPTAAAGAASRP